MGVEVIFLLTMSGVVMLLLIFGIIVPDFKHYQQDAYAQKKKKRQPFRAQFLLEVEGAMLTGNHAITSMILNELNVPLYEEIPFRFFNSKRKPTENELLEAKISSLFLKQFALLDVSFERASYLFGERAAVQLFNLNAS